MDQQRDAGSGRLTLRRRKLIALLGRTALAWPDARGQEPGRTYRIGVLATSSRFLARADEVIE